MLLAATGIILLSLVSEDAATVSSALSIFGGPLRWPIGFASCFAGIWVGDLGLYWLARLMGRPILQKEWVARFAGAETVRRCEQGFERHGVLALFVSRFVPGTRLTTYLTAGLVSMPAGTFTLVTGLGALIWIGLIFLLTSVLGSAALAGLATAGNRIGAVVFTALCLGLVLLGLKRLARSQPTLRRWGRWEFWPAWLFYLPVAIYYLWLSLRYRSLTLPTVANPGMQSGGFVGESKFAILQQLQRTSPTLVARTLLIDEATFTDRLLSLHALCREHRIAPPFILKPDVGQRGHGVRLIQSMEQAFEYLREVNAPVLLQEYVAGPNEAGVFYFRNPCSNRGRIFSITEKIFPTIKGDGIRTIEALIRADPRASLIAGTYLQRFRERTTEILPPGQELKLVETGNHAQGCIFCDGGRLWSEELEKRIDGVSRRFPGFFVGRFDIRYEDEREFRAGRNLQIVELNGSSSEATSVYDARNSLFVAYRTLFRQWRIVFRIGATNRARGMEPLSLKAIWQEWRHYSRLALSYPCAS